VVLALDRNLLRIVLPGKYYNLAGIEVMGELYLAVYDAVSSDIMA